MRLVFILTPLVHVYKIQCSQWYKMYSVYSVSLLYSLHFYHFFLPFVLSSALFSLSLSHLISSLFSLSRFLTLCFSSTQPGCFHWSWKKHTFTPPINCNENNEWKCIFHSLCRMHVQIAFNFVWSAYPTMKLQFRDDFDGNES